MKQRPENSISGRSPAPISAWSVFLLYSKYLVQRYCALIWERISPQRQESLFAKSVAAAASGHSMLSAQDIKADSRPSARTLELSCKDLRMAEGWLLSFRHSSLIRKSFLSVMHYQPDLS